MGMHCALDESEREVIESNTTRYRASSNLFVGLYVQRKFSEEYSLVILRLSSSADKYDLELTFQRSLGSSSLGLYERHTAVQLARFLSEL